MKYVHNFDTVSAFTESYNGEGYEEPWVSYVKETEAVNYNKIITKKKSGLGFSHMERVPIHAKRRKY